MGLERWVDHCDVCYFVWMIAHLRKTAVPIFFTPGKSSPNQYHACDKIRQVNCVLHERFISPDVLSGTFAATFASQTYDIN